MTASNSTSEIIAAAKAATAELTRARAAREELAARAQEHTRQTEEDKWRLAEAEKELQAHHMALALGSQDVPPAPDMSELENLRAKIAVADAVDTELKMRVTAAEQKVEEAESARNSSISHYIRETALDPALAELSVAWEQVRCAIEKILPAHNLAYHEFNERSRGGDCVDDLYGPAAHFVTMLRSSATRRLDYPYSVKPDWLPFGYVGNCNMPGVSERKRALLQQVEAELAA